MRTKHISLTLFLLIFALIVVYIGKSKKYKQFNTAYIYQTSDIHGYLKHSKSDKNGGWLKLASVIENEIEKSGGESNCLLIDCGDTLQGSVEAAMNRGSLAVDFLNLLNYNIFVPGNHDFDYGLNYILNIISKLKPDVLAANLKLEVNNFKIKPWKVYDINNIKIAVIGMTSPYITYWLGRKIFENYSLTSIIEELNKIMPDIINTKPDIIVLAMHHGFYNSKRFPGKDQLLRNIIKEFPQIDLVLGGHTHRAYSGELVYPDTLFVQPGEHGRFLTKVKITVNKLLNDTPDIQTELVPVTSEIPASKKFDRLLKTTLEQLDINSKKVIANLVDTISSNGIPGKKCKITELFAKSIFFSVKTDAVMCTVLNQNKTLKGQVTYKDIYHICPYEDSIMILALSFEQLEEIFNEQIQFKSKYRKRLGLYIKSKNGVRGISNIEQLRHYFKNNKKIRVAFSSYDIAGAGNRYPILRKIALGSKNNLFNTQIMLRDTVYKYLFNNGLNH